MVHLSSNAIAWVVRVRFLFSWIILMRLFLLYFFRCFFVSNLPDNKLNHFRTQRRNKNRNGNIAICCGKKDKGEKRLFIPNMNTVEQTWTEHIFICLVGLNVVHVANQKNRMKNYVSVELMFAHTQHNQVTAQNT